MNDFKGTEIKLTNRYGTVSVYVTHDDLTITDLLNNLVRPLLKAATYPDQLVDEFLPYQEGAFDVTYSI